MKVSICTWLPWQQHVDYKNKYLTAQPSQTTAKAKAKALVASRHKCFSYARRVKKNGAEVMRRNRHANARRNKGLTPQGGTDASPIRRVLRRGRNISFWCSSETRPMGAKRFFFALASLLATLQRLPPSSFCEYSIPLSTPHYLLLFSGSAGAGAMS